MFGLRFAGFTKPSLPTLLINEGGHMKTISARHGHSKIGITMDLYGHTLDSADEAAANKFDHLFQQNKQENA